MRNMFLFTMLAVLAYSCKKGPSSDELQGTWTEVTNSADVSKLIFEGNDRLYFFHSTAIDTFSYTIDRKHFTIYLTRVHPSIIETAHQIQYHKRKKIINVWGLFPPTGGLESVTNYQQ